MSFDSYGRDHQELSGGFLLAGGYVRGGTRYGETDEWGWDVVWEPVHVRDLQATVLHALGLEHRQIVTRYQGRDFRLSDVSGNVIHALLALVPRVAESFKRRTRTLRRARPAAPRG